MRMIVIRDVSVEMRIFLYKKETLLLLSCTLLICFRGRTKMFIICCVNKHISVPVFYKIVKCFIVHCYMRTKFLKEKWRRKEKKRKLFSPSSMKQWILYCTDYNCMQCLQSFFKALNIEILYF